MYIPVNNSIDPTDPPPPLLHTHTFQTPTHPPIHTGALILPCDDPRCWGRCHQPDEGHFCGPHGGSCTRSPLAPPLTNKTHLAAVGGLPPLPPHVPADQCSFNWSYGAGQYASRATGVLMRGTVALGPLVVPDATFGAILKGACACSLAWIGSLVVVCVVVCVPAWAC